jgi:Ni,Fe-hydrogenase maturation factor
VIFVDACVDGGGELRLGRVSADAARPRGPLDHTGGPEELLALARQVYGASPEAWLMGLPAFSFEVGEPISERAAEGLRRAWPVLRDLMTGAEEALNVQ